MTVINREVKVGLGNNGKEASTVWIDGKGNNNKGQSGGGWHNRIGNNNNNITTGFWFTRNLLRILF